MKIQQAAKQTGLSIYTLRYYEQAGLLLPIKRLSNGHREFTVDDVNHIIFVTRLRSTGMPIMDIKRYVELSQHGNSTISERLKLLEEHEVSIEERIEELNQHLALIRKKVEYYRNFYKATLSASQSSSVL
jgi:DNA-binding transcriptional MerR regulator